MVYTQSQNVLQVRPPICANLAIGNADMISMYVHMYMYILPL